MSDRKRNWIDGFIILIGCMIFVRWGYELKTKIDASKQPTFAAGDSVKIFYNDRQWDGRIIREKSANGRYLVIRWTHELDRADTTYVSPGRLEIHPWQVFQEEKEINIDLGDE